MHRVWHTMSDGLRQALVPAAVASVSVPLPAPTQPEVAPTQVQSPPGDAAVDVDPTAQVQPKSLETPDTPQGKRQPTRQARAMPRHMFRVGVLMILGLIEPRPVWPLFRRYSPNPSDLRGAFASCC